MELVDIELVLCTESPSEVVSLAPVVSLDIVGITLLDPPLGGVLSFVSTEDVSGAVLVTNDSPFETVDSKATVELVSLYVASMVVLVEAMILTEVPPILVNNPLEVAVEYIIVVSMSVSGKDVEPGTSD